MCTTIGFKYQDGIVFGRTLEISIELDNKIMYIPKGYKNFITTSNGFIDAKYAVLGSAFFDIVSFGDGINEKGLMGSNNYFINYASFSNEIKANKINMTTSNAFDYILSNCANIKEVKDLASKINIVEKLEENSMPNHFFFMDKDNNKVVLEPKDGTLMIYENPFNVLTNAPYFDFHLTNMKNYINISPNNIDEKLINDYKVIKLGEGSGMLGLPGDFTPPSRFVRAAYFVSNTPKDLAREAAILQAFRILSQFDIPKGAIYDAVNNHYDETLYTAIMDSSKLSYHLKAKNNINIQSFYLEDFSSKLDVVFVDLQKTINL